jgi:Ca2+-binding EF-hand superfamily protein
MTTLSRTRLGAALVLAAGVALGAVGIGSAVAQQSAPPTDEQIAATFKAADANNDGFVNVDEAVADAILAFARFDANRDGFLVVAELPRHDPNRIKRADRDGDGRLSVGEVAADRVYEFFLVDTNRDGVISLQEVLVYVKQQRAAK